MITTKRNDVAVSRVKDIPEVEHWVVFIDESLSYDSGYDHLRGSDSTLQYITYRMFLDEEAVREFIIKDDAATYGRKTYRVARVIPATVQKQVSIKIT